jgi:hypothetical protein
MTKIDPILRKIFLDKSMKLVERPEAKTWDDEYRNYFKGIGIKIKKSDTLYTSVHYVVEINRSSKITAEI